MITIDQIVVGALLINRDESSPRFNLMCRVIDIGNEESRLYYLVSHESRLTSNYLIAPFFDLVTP